MERILTGRAWRVNTKKPDSFQLAGNKTFCIFSERCCRLALHPCVDWPGPDPDDKTG